MWVNISMKFHVDILNSFKSQSGHDFVTETATYILDMFLIIWTPFLFISVFESTAYLKFANLQYVSSGFRCRVITGSLMRVY